MDAADVSYDTSLDADADANFSSLDSADAEKKNTFASASRRECVNFFFY